MIRRREDIGDENEEHLGVVDHEDFFAGFRSRRLREEQPLPDEFCAGSSGSTCGRLAGEPTARARRSSAASSTGSSVSLNRAPGQPTISSNAARPIDRARGGVSRFGPAGNEFRPTCFPRPRSGRSAVLPARHFSWTISTTCKSRSVPRRPDMGRTAQGPSSAWTAAPNSARSNGFSMNWIAPAVPRSARNSREVPVAITSTRASG